MSANDCDAGDRETGRWESVAFQVESESHESQKCLFFFLNPFSLLTMVPVKKLTSKQGIVLYRTCAAALHLRMKLA